MSPHQNKKQKTKNKEGFGPEDERSTRNLNKSSMKDPQVTIYFMWKGLKYYCDV